MIICNLLWLLAFLIDFDFGVATTWEDWEELVIENQSKSDEEIAPLLLWPDIPERYKLKVVQQIRQDLGSAMFAPSLESFTEYNDSEITRDGTIALGNRLIGSTVQSAIHEIKFHPRFVIKYTTDCLEEHSPFIHPSLIELWFLQHVEHLGISPAPIAVSSPAPIPSRKTFKCFFNIKQDAWDRCVADNAVVRYTIMERVGPNLYTMLTRSAPLQRFSLRQSIESGIQIIRLLKTLHLQARVIHADIHYGNICVSADGSRLVLIDYGRSFHIDDYPQDERIRPDRSWNHPLFSPWEIAGFRPGPRDDVYKAMLLVAFLMNGNAYYNFLKSIEGDVERSLAIKETENIFIAFPGYNPLDFLGPRRATKRRIATVLLDVVNSVRSLNSVAELPAYDSIIVKFESILGMF